MKRVIKKCPITFNGVDGWEVMVNDVDVYKRYEIPCDNCMYYGNLGCDGSVTCMDIHRCTHDVYAYFVFVEGYLPGETGKEKTSWQR